MHAVGAPKHGRSGGVVVAAPGWDAREVEVAGADLAVDGRERQLAPAFDAGHRPRQVVATEETDGPRLERVALQLTADHAAVEQQRVEREAREAEAQAVE